MDAETKAKLLETYDSQMRSITKWLDSHAEELDEDRLRRDLKSALEAMDGRKR